MLLKKKFQLIMVYLTFWFCNSCFGRLGQMHFWIRIQEIILNPDALNILKITREIVDCELNNNFQTVVEIWNILAKCKVNSVQEACAKCFAVHMLKFEILQTTWKTKNIRMLDLLMKNWELCSLFQFFHVVWKISNFDMWTTKHLAQASRTEFTLPSLTIHWRINKSIYFLELSQNSSKSCLWVERAIKKHFV